MVWDTSNSNDNQSWIMWPANGFLQHRPSLLQQYTIRATSCKEILQPVPVHRLQP